jgi:malate dehydrogenase
LDDVICTADLAVGFKDADFVVFLGAFPRKDGMERKDLLDKNAGIFKTQGEALDKHAKRTVKSLVVGNPANTNCATLVAMAPGLPPHNFSALTRLDHNRATAQLAAKAGVGNGAVKNVTIWGNHSATQVPDISAATINGAPAKQIVTDHDWVKNGFISSVQQRGALIIKMRQLSSAASAAVAIADHLRDWHHGTAPGVHVSMAVPSDGSYGVPKGLVFSYPVVIANGAVQIVQNIAFDDDVRARIEITKQELLDEQKTAFAALGISPPKL